MYAQNAISINEFHGHSWSKVALDFNTQSHVRNAKWHQSVTVIFWIAQNTKHECTWIVPMHNTQFFSYDPIMAFYWYILALFQQFANQNITMGEAILTGYGLFNEKYWFWIGVGALFGYAVVLNILFTMFLTILNRKFMFPYEGQKNFNLFVIVFSV